MTAIKTMQMLDDLPSQNFIEIDELKKTPNSLEEMVAEYQRQRGITLDEDDYDLVLGQFERGIEDPLIMRDVVAIVKEVRAEMYAEEQEQKMAACR